MLRHFIHHYWHKAKMIDYWECEGFKYMYFLYEITRRQQSLRLSLMFKTILLMRFRKRLEVWSIMIKWKFCLSIHNGYQLLLCLLATFARSTTQFQTFCMNRGTGNLGIDIFRGCVPLSKQIIKKKFRPNCVCVCGGVNAFLVNYPV